MTQLFFVLAFEFVHIVSVNTCRVIFYSNNSCDVLMCALFIIA